MPELVLDTAIRTWVFVPIVAVTFFFGILRHYLTILMSNPKAPDLQKVKDSQLLLRVRMLRENSKYIPKSAFLIRKQFMNDKENGKLVVAQQREVPTQNPMANPEMMSDMLKGNLTNMLPMIAIGGWINSTFAGFVATKVPIPLTEKFKMMLQRGISLQSLDPSWVSSASWYFLCVFGLRQIYQLVLGADNSADQTKAMQDTMSANANMATGMPQDPRAIFKAEWESLEMTNHKYQPYKIEERLMKRRHVNRHQI